MPGARKGKSTRAAASPRAAAEARTLPAPAYLSKKVPGFKRGEVSSVICIMPNQEGVDEGKARYWCIECGNAFQARPVNGDAPETCPKGHKNAELE
jgi:hypothetical protein